MKKRLSAKNLIYICLAFLITAIACSVGVTSAYFSYLKTIEGENSFATVELQLLQNGTAVTDGTQEGLAFTFTEANKTVNAKLQLDAADCTTDVVIRVMFALNLDTTDAQIQQEMLESITFNYADGWLKTTTDAYGDRYDFIYYQDKISSGSVLTVFDGFTLNSSNANLFNVEGSLIVYAEAMQVNEEIINANWFYNSTPQTIELYSISTNSSVTWEPWN